jgi:GcrA cell cycle regulator
MVWSADKVEKLEKMWREGLSAGVIAERLGVVSRSAVLGRLHRMGLTGQPGRKAEGVRTLTRERRNRKRKLIPRDSKPVSYTRPARSARTGLQIDGPAYEPAPPPEPHEFDQQRLASGETLPIDERLQEHHCRWPVGAPDLVNWRVCCLTKVPGLPYCEHHVQRAYTSAHSAELRPLRTFANVSTVILGETHAHANVAEFLEPV